MFWPLQAGRIEVLKDRNKGMHGGTADEATAELLGTDTAKQIWEQPTQRVHKGDQNGCHVGHCQYQSEFLVDGRGRHAHLVQLRIMAGNIEMNPGPRRYVCPVCKHTIKDRSAASVWCHKGGWVHLRCKQLTKTCE